MGNATIVVAEAVRSNRQLTSKVGCVLAKLLHTRIDNDELFKCCKDLKVEKKNLGGKVESLAVGRMSLPRWLKS